MKSKIAINGRIFEFPQTGVGRFCSEVIREIDKRPEAEHFVLLLSKNAKNVPELHNIQVLTIGFMVGIIWEQVEFPIYAMYHGMKTLNMSNSVPLLCPNYVVIHDISLKENRNDTTSIKEKIKIWWPLLHYWVSSKFAKKIFTVSKCQKKAIIKHYRIPPDKIIVVYSGWQHMKRIEEDNKILQKYSLSEKKYFFAISTRAKNKNFKWVLDAAKAHPEDKFVVSGKFDTKYFSDNIDLNMASNIISTGYVSDGEMKALISHCKAFLYPSTYEGFGLPPLEALSVGSEAIISNVSCLPEIYGDSVYYIDPFNQTIELNGLLGNLKSRKENVLNKYSWEKTARLLLSGIE